MVYSSGKRWTELLWKHNPGADQTVRTADNGQWKPYQTGEQTARLFSGPDSTFNIPNIATWKGNVGLTIHVADLFYANVIGNWVGKRSVLGTNPHGPVDGYFVTNCAVTSHKFFNDHFYISLTVKNLFDVKYLDPGIRTADGTLYSTVLEQPRITGILKITASF